MLRFHVAGKLGIAFVLSASLGQLPAIADSPTLPDGNSDEGKFRHGKKDNERI
ncbi:MAG: hypothetical protein ACOC04_01925 [Halothece sp.]